MRHAEGSIYQEFAPTGALVEIVARYWCLTASESLVLGHLHRLLPDGCVDLVVVARDGGFLSVRGPRDTPLDLPLHAGEHFWGARLWLDLGGRLLGVSAKLLRDIQAPAHTFFGPEVDAVAGRVALAGESSRSEFDAWLTTRLPDIPPLDAQVRLALVAQHAANGALSAAELGSLVGLSARQLQRQLRCSHRDHGEDLPRIRRLRPALGHVLAGGPVSWAGVAASPHSSGALRSLRSSSDRSSPKRTARPPSQRRARQPWRGSHSWWVSGREMSGP